MVVAFLDIISSFCGPRRNLQPVTKLKGKRRFFFFSAEVPGWTVSQGCEPLVNKHSEIYVATMTVSAYS